VQGVRVGRNAGLPRYNQTRNTACEVNEPSVPRCAVMRSGKSSLFSHHTNAYQVVAAWNAMKLVITKHQMFTAFLITSVESLQLHTLSHYSTPQLSHTHWCTASFTIHYHIGHDTSSSSPLSIKGWGWEGGVCGVGQRWGKVQVGVRQVCSVCWVCAHHQCKGN